MSPPRSVLITGASGFVGRHLLPALRSGFPDTRLIPTSRRSGEMIDGLSVARLDLDSAADVRATLEAMRPEAVIHLSGVASTRLANEDPAETWRANVGQAVRLAESVRSHMPHTFFVFVSSASIYGASAASGDPIDEDAALLPADVYGRTKAEADRIIGDMARDGLKAVRLRPFNHTGPGQSAEYLVPTMARQIALIEAGKANGTTVRVLSRSSARDYLDVRDVCAAYIEALRRRHTLDPGTALNIASGRALSVDEIFASLRDLARTPVELADQGKSTSIPVMRGDASRAGVLLGWEPRIAFTQTLADTLDWWRGEVARGA